MAHEIGHALGMDHDYGNGDISRHDSNGNNCKSGYGVMSHGLNDGDRSQVDRFSTCSKEDFSKWFKKKSDRSSCLASSKLILYLPIYIPVFLGKIYKITMSVSFFVIQIAHFSELLLNTEKSIMYKYRNH